MTTRVKYDDCMTIKFPTGTTDTIRRVASFVGLKPADIYRRAVQKELRLIQDEMEAAAARKANRKGKV